MKANSKAAVAVVAIKRNQSKVCLCGGCACPLTRQTTHYRCCIRLGSVPPLQQPVALAMGNGSSRSPRVADLPSEVIVLVLQHVDTQHRLENCALVSPSWAAAATAATHSIDTSCADVEVLLPYLDKHGQHVIPSRCAARSCSP